jgi:hypothetical protein
VAKAELALNEKNFVVTITRKEFTFEHPHRFSEYETQAKTGFLKKGDYEVKRMSGSNIFHHIPVKKFVAGHPSMMGVFNFAVERTAIKMGIEQVTLTLDVSNFPKDHEALKEVRSLLVG